MRFNIFHTMNGRVLEFLKISETDSRLPSNAVLLKMIKYGYNLGYYLAPDGITLHTQEEIGKVWDSFFNTYSYFEKNKYSHEIIHRLKDCVGLIDAIKNTAIALNSDELAWRAFNSQYSLYVISERIKKERNIVLTGVDQYAPFSFQVQVGEYSGGLNYSMSSGIWTINT